MNFIKQKQIFANTEGSIIKQQFIKTGSGISVIAINDDDMQIRSYPSNFGGDYRHAGYEFIEELDFKNHINRICYEAEELLKAPLCPSGIKDIILDGNQMSIQIHESIGHPIELDRVLGMELSFAGTSFLKISDIDNLKYASDIVSVYSDPTIEYGLGSYGFDDEGIKSRRDCIIENGLFKGFITSRETSHVINKLSNASVKAQDWNYLPIIRMSNINLEAGNWKLENLIEDTKDGLYLETNRSWSIDDKRWNFQFGTEIAREIKNGKLGKIYKNPTYTDNTIHFWNSCDAICNKDYWKIWGIPNCGKGQPMQNAYVGHGTSPARFRNIKVGIL
jgi:TldD protein